MKSPNCFLFLLTAFMLPLAVSAQSKKVLNQNLKSELAHQVAVQDSMQTSLLSKQKQLNTLREEAQGDAKFSVKFKNKETEIRTILLRNHRLLKELHFDANTVCNLNETLKLPAPKATVSYDKNSDLQKQKFQLASIDSIGDLTEVKLKEQNEILKRKVAQYDSVNKLNGAVLNDMQGVIDQITKIREGYAAHFKSYQEFNNDLATKSDLLATKFFEVRTQLIKEEAIEQEKERVKELKEMERRKKKNPNELVFIPPFIEGQSAYDEIGEPAFIPQNDREVFRDPRSIPELREKQPVVLDVVEEPAEFPGGMAALKKYLSENMNYPKTAEENGIEGKVFLKFKVMDTGKIQDVRIARGLSGCPECDQEAIRLAENMPLWKPGKLNGKPISMYYNLPITFKLH